MKIKDISKLDKKENPLEINSYDYSLERYKTFNNKYYPADEEIVKDENTTISGSIYQNESGIIEETTRKDFSTLPSMGVPKDLNNEEHKDNTIYNFRNETILGETKEEAINILEKNKLGEGILPIVSNVGEQDKTEFFDKLKSNLIASANIGDVVGEYNKISDNIKYMFGETPKGNSLDVSNSNINKLKEDIKKEVPIDNYQESIYYNDLLNINNTSQKILRGDLTNDLEHPINTLKGYVGPLDDGWRDSDEDLTNLNLSSKYNMYTNRAGHTPLAKNDVPNFINNNIISDNVSELREKSGDFVNEIPSFEKEIVTTRNNLSDDPSNGYTYASKNKDKAKFSPSLLSDAQARTFTILKNKNTFNNQTGYIYVKPFYSFDNGSGRTSFKNFNIPFEFKPNISEGSINAKYQAETLLGRIGAMQVFTGTEPSTLSITAEYISLSPDEYNASTADKQFSVNAWEYYWTDSRIEEIELKYRSLVFPVVTGKNYLLKPPIIQIKMTNPGYDERDNVGYLYKYPYTVGEGNGGLEEYFKISPVDRYKKYIVTSVQIDKNDNGGITTVPTIYKYSEKETPGIEGDGQNSHIEYAENNNYSRSRGFKVTLQCVEVSENFLDIVPDFAAYYNAWNSNKEIADSVSSKANSSLQVKMDKQEIIDSLKANSNTLSSFLGTSEEKIKGLLEKAYILGDYYCYPEKMSSLYDSYYSMLYLIYSGNQWQLPKDKKIESVYKSNPKIIEDSIKKYTLKDGLNIFKPRADFDNTIDNSFITNSIEEDKGDILIKSSLIDYDINRECIIEKYDNTLTITKVCESLKLFPELIIKDKEQIIKYKGKDFKKIKENFWESEEKDFIKLDIIKETKKINLEINMMFDKYNKTTVKEEYKYNLLKDSNKKDYYIQTQEINNSTNFGNIRYFYPSKFSTFKLNCNKNIPSIFSKETSFSNIGNEYIISYLDEYFTQYKNIQKIYKDLENLYKKEEDRDRYKKVKEIFDFTKSIKDSMDKGTEIVYINELGKKSKSKIKMPGIDILNNSIQKAFDNLFLYSSFIEEELKNLGIECKNNIKLSTIDIIRSALENNEKFLLVSNIDGDANYGNFKDAFASKFIGISNFGKVKEYNSEYEFIKDLSDEYFINYENKKIEAPKESYAFSGAEANCKDIDSLYKCFGRDYLKNDYKTIMKPYKTTPTFSNIEETASPDNNNFYLLKKDNGLLLTIEEFINYEYNGELPDNKEITSLPAKETCISSFDASRSELLKEKNNFDEKKSVIYVSAGVSDAKEEQSEIDSALEADNEELEEGEE